MIISFVFFLLLIAFQWEMGVATVKQRKVTIRNKISEAYLILAKDKQFTRSYRAGLFVRGDLPEKGAIWDEIHDDENNEWRFINREAEDGEPGLSLFASSLREGMMGTINSGKCTYEAYGFRSVWGVKLDEKWQGYENVWEVQGPLDSCQIVNKQNPIYTEVLYSNAGGDRDRRPVFVSFVNSTERMKRNLWEIEEYNGPKSNGISPQ